MSPCATSAWLGFVACFTVIGASVELVKYYIERSRVEVLKEVKGLELQLLEIKDHLQQSQASNRPDSGIRRQGRG